MSRRILDAIGNAIADAAYDLTRHAVEEMAEDELLLADVEHAMLTGAITKVETDDPRGTRYTIVGMAEDLKTEVGVVGRFTETGVYLIITVYEATTLSG